VAGLWAWKREKSNGGVADGAGEKVSKEVKVKGIREISHPAASLGARRVGKKGWRKVVCGCFGGGK